MTRREIVLLLATTASTSALFAAGVVHAAQPTRATLYRTRNARAAKATRSISRRTGFRSR